MKISNVLDLIKYHYEGKENDFRNQAYEIAREFDAKGDSQVSSYILGLINPRDVFVPQENLTDDEFVKLIYSGDPLPLPKTIVSDLEGIINAINHNIGVNKFLFVGEPGTGKTQSALQISRLLSREVYSVDINNILDSKLGESSKNLSQLFTKINCLPNLDRLVILFDEIDAIAMDRINNNDIREMGRVTSTFLKCLDELNSNVVLIATTNLFDSFDKALSRRFDAIISFDRYSREDLIEVCVVIFNSYLKHFKDVTKDIRLFKKIVNSCINLPNPGDLKNIIKSSLAFSSHDNPSDYLSRLLSNLHADVSRDNLFDVSYLSNLGFTIREIEVLTGISKSSVSRMLKVENNE